MAVFRDVDLSTQIESADSGGEPDQSELSNMGQY